MPETLTGDGEQGVRDGRCNRAEAKLADTTMRAPFDGEIGEVCARGPSIFAGYYNDPEATAESLLGRLESAR